MNKIKLHNAVVNVRFTIYEIICTKVFKLSS